MHNIFLWKGSAKIRNQNEPLLYYDIFNVTRIRVFFSYIMEEIF